MAGALAGFCFAALAGAAFAGGRHPDPPPKPPPPPPPVYHPPPPPPVVVAPPPPPPVYVAPPPPPTPVVHAKSKAEVHKHVRRHAVAKPKRVAAKKTPVRESGLAGPPLLAAGAPVAAASSGSISPALLIVAFGVALALLAVGVSFMPASAVPFALGLRLERSRQTIMLFGLAIGVACALVGLLTAVVGR